MVTVIYCAIKLHDAARRRVTAAPVHENVYGEHVTLRFYGRDGGTDTPFAGVHVELMADKHFVNECGEAWSVSCTDPTVQELKAPEQRLHITVSCAPGIKPVYSNTLIELAQPDNSAGMFLRGTIAYFMSDGTWRM